MIMKCVLNPVFVRLMVFELSAIPVEMPFFFFHVVNGGKDLGLSILFGKI